MVLLMNVYIGLQLMNVCQDDLLLETDLYTCMSTGVKTIRALNRVGAWARVRSTDTQLVSSVRAQGTAASPASSFPLRSSFRPQSLLSVLDLASTSKPLICMKSSGY